MRIDRLEITALVAELGSLSRAAKSLGMAQSAVSRHIALLEAHWGDRVFERTGRGVTLTEFGQRMLPQMRLLLVQAQRLDDEAREASGVPSGQVHLGILPSISGLVVGRLLNTLRADYPAIRLRVTEGFSGVLDGQITSGQIDLAVINRYGRTAARGEEVLGKLETYVIGRPGNKLLAQQGEGQLPFAQLSRLSLAVPGTPNGLRAVLDQIASRKRVALDIGVEIDTISVIKEVVMQSDVCALLPYTAIHEEAGRGALLAAQVVQPTIPRTISVAVTRQRPLSRAARVVLKEISKLVPAVLKKYGAAA